MSSFFSPTSSLIQAITKGVQTTVTFTTSCTFSPGEVVSFRVNKIQGTTQLNNVAAVVQQVTTVTNPNDTIIVNIDSRNFTPFTFTAENVGKGPAMAVPSSSGIVPGAIPVQTNLVDAFDNVPVT